MTTKETPLIIRAYDFTSETLLTKNLQRPKLEIKTRN
jgi:hypothetical protein